MGNVVITTLVAFTFLGFFLVPILSWIDLEAQVSFMFFSSIDVESQWYYSSTTQVGRIMGSILHVFQLH